MSDYMPKCATCEHFESCIMQKHITEMALILWNISREKEKERTVNKPTAEPKQGKWIDKAISIIDDMRGEGIVDYEQAREFRMRARLKGADDEV